MIKPTKYKSINAAALKNRTTSELTEQEKNKVSSIINKFTQLVKVKHT